MKEFFLWVFSPGKNRYVILGLILSILGVILIPFIVGIPIAGIGFTIFAIGVMIAYGQRISEDKRAIEELKKAFSKIKIFIKTIVHPSSKNPKR